MKLSILVDGLSARLGGARAGQLRARTEAAAIEAARLERERQALPQSASEEALRRPLFPAGSGNN